MSMCPIANEVNFDHMVTMIPVRFLHCEDTIIFFEINKYIMRRYFETL